MAQSYQELHEPPFVSETQYGRGRKGYSPLPTDENQTPVGQPPPYDSRPSSTGFRPAPYPHRPTYPQPSYPAPAPSIQQQQSSVRNTVMIYLHVILIIYKRQ